MMRVPTLFSDFVDYVRYLHDSEFGLGPICMRVTQRRSEW